MALGRSCVVTSDGTPGRVAASRCEEGSDTSNGTSDGTLTGTIEEYAYVSNTLGNSLAVATFNQSLPELLDSNRAVPGVTHIPVGQYPTDVVVSQDGNFIFTLNQISQDISVVLHNALREVDRIPVGRPFAHLLGLQGQDALVYMTPDDNTLNLVEWSFSCGDGEGKENGVGLDCTPTITATTRAIYTFPDRTIPNSLTLGASSDRLYATFSNRPTLGVLLLDNSEASTALSCIDGRSSAPCLWREFPLTYGCLDQIDNDGDGLIDAQDPQCVSPTASESDTDPGLNLATVCSDGIDNDGDGMIDAQDTGCTHPADASETDALTPIACSDGIDNDGDGLVDAFDPECTNLALGTWNPWHIAEDRRPQCSDGLDNDGDGDTDFPADPACEDPDYDTEAAVPSANTACTDGIDNDLDGAVDLDDPACVEPTNTTELQGIFACSNGLDDDGDGLADYPADPDCYSAAGTTEGERAVNVYGPVAIDPEGLFAYVVDRTDSQILVIDLIAGELLNANQDVPSDTRLGVPVGRLPTTITARQIEEEIESTTLDGEEVADGDTRITRKVVFANVAATRGVAYYVEAADYYRSFDGSSEEPNQEVRNLLLRLADGNTREPASSTVNCSIDDELLNRVRGERDEPGSDVSCDDQELPTIVPTATVEEGDDSSEELEEVTFTTVERTTLTLNDDGEAEEQVETFTEDYRVVPDEWTVTYEGLIVERSDIFIDDTLPYLIRSQGGDFCSSGVEPGDLLTIASSPTPADEETDCSVFEQAELFYRVADVQSNQIVIAVLSQEEVANLNRDSTDGSPVIDRLPNRTCFAEGLTVEVRAQGEWVVRGNRLGLLVNQQGVSGVCVPRYDWELYQFRAQTGERFDNPYFSFNITEGAVTPTQDFTLRFDVSSSSGFSSLVFSVGPSSSDIQYFETERGFYLSVVDTGTNIVRVYDANTLRLLNLLF